ncbi:MAG TPA: response regulator [Alphaproteobacteria bacterium]
MMSIKQMVERTVMAGPPTIYLVDDDEAVRDSLTVLLESYGLSVRAYDSALAFLADYRPGEHACLLLDLHMPGMSGLDLLERTPPGRLGMPVIVITGRADPDARRRALAAGVGAVLDKPFRDDDLLTAIVRAVGAPASGR